MLRVRTALGLVLSVTMATGAQAQIGGLIKRKAAEAVKPKNEPPPKAKAAENLPSSAKFPFDLTADNLTAFKQALDLEHKLREEYRAEVAKVKTREQYKKCESQAATSTDAQKAHEEYMARSEKVKTAEDVTKLTAWQNEAYTAVMLKHCGPDPAPLIDAQQDRFTKAQEKAAFEFAKSFRKSPSHDQQPRSREPDDASAAGACLSTAEGEEEEFTATCPTVEILPAVQRAPDAGTDPRVLEYLRTIELVTKYCSLSKEMRADAAKNGIRVPGTGTDIYWVFTKEFANWVGDACDDVLKRINLINK